MPKRRSSTVFYPFVVDAVRTTARAAIAACRAAAYRQDAERDLTALIMCISGTRRSVLIAFLHAAAIGAAGRAHMTPMTVE